MAKLTRDQYNKWNAQAKNGFYFDIEYYLIWGEKTLTKKIKLDDGIIIQFRLWYISEYETKVNEYGCRWNVKTGRKIPVMKINRLVPCKTEGMYQVISVAENRQMAEPEKTMKYSTLCKISSLIDTDVELQKIA